MSELKGCGSHSCAVSPPVGVGNNGPCRCMVSDYRGQSLVRSLQARIDELSEVLTNEGLKTRRELQARIAELEEKNENAI